MTRPTIYISLISILLTGFVTAAAQRSKRRQAPKTPVTATAKPSVVSEPETPEVKKNERPGTTAPTVKSSQAYIPTFFYKYERPGFAYPSISIEHDERGRGTITFSRNGEDGTYSDPIALTAQTLADLEATFLRMDFLGSVENYQYVHDRSTMGNVEITLKKDGRQRTVRYNWTENKDAKFLMDEYRRISNEYIWKFELGIARENQPLETPRLLDTLDGYMRANEIADPPHLKPLLTELLNDERLPLIARNHASRLIQLIDKNAAKK